MKIVKAYRQTTIPASKLDCIRDYLGTVNSESLGEQWGHKIWWYTLHYRPSEEIKCANFDEVKQVIGSRGDTNTHVTYFESITGRCLRLDTTDPTRITVEADNQSLTIKFLARVEALLQLQELPRRVFVTHGRSLAWLEVQRYIEKHALLNLEAIELADEPNKGRTISLKLSEEGDQCSYAVIVMTGDDVTEDGEMRTRENVMHEIGFFQGRYGFDRICLLREEGVNIPSNLSGIAYYPFPKNLIKATFADLQKELRAAFP